MNSRSTENNPFKDSRGTQDAAPTGRVRLPSARRQPVRGADADSAGLAGQTARAQPAPAGGRSDPIDSHLLAAGEEGSGGGATVAAPAARAPATPLRPVATAGPSRVFCGWALAGILLLAAGLRVHHLTRQSFWLDEFLSLETSFGRAASRAAMPHNALAPAPAQLTDAGAAAPWWTAWAAAPNAVHPPLYFILLRLWLSAFGTGDAAARSLSLVASVAAVALLYDAGRLLHGRGPALWACLLMAVAGPQIAYAQEARSYALLLALGLGACGAVVRLEKLGWNRRRAAALAGCALAMLLTHHLAFAPVAVLGVYAALRLRGPCRRRALAALAGAGAAYALLYVQALAPQLQNAAAKGQWMVEAPEPWTMRACREVQYLAALPARFLSDAGPVAGGPAGLSVVVYALPFLLLRRRPDLLLWGLWLGGIVGVIAVLDFARGSLTIQYLRYTLLADPAVYLVIAAVMAHRRGLLRHLLPALAAASCAAALALGTDADAKAPWRDMGEFLARNVRPGEVTVFAAPRPPRPAPGTAAGPDVEWYCLGVSRYVHLPGPVVLLDGPADAALCETLRRSPGVWLVTPADDGAPAASLVPGAVAEQRQFYPYFGKACRLRLPAPGGE